MIKKQKKFNLLAIVALILIQTGIILNVNAITTDQTKKGTTDPASELVTDTATLEVTGVAATDTFKAYKILNTYYNPTTNTVTYEFTTDFANYLQTTTEYRSYTINDYYKLTSGSHTTGSVTTTSTLDKLVSGYASYIKTNSITGSDMTGTNTTRTATLSSGSYLVLPTTTNKIYAVMIGNLDYEANGTDWKLNNETIVAKISEPGVATKSVETNGKNSTSFPINHEYSYIITGTVPQYPSNATNKTYKIIDTMSSGITFSGINNVVIEDGTTRLNIDSDGNITNSSNQSVGKISLAVANQEITFNFNLDYITGTTITITYKAKLNDQAVIGSIGNANNASLTYSNDPYGTDVTHNAENDSKTIVYTYGIQILKYSGSSKATTLSNATFEVYSDAGLTDKVGQITTGNDGLGTIKGLKAGVYYLKETKAPIAHTLLKEAIAVKVGTADATESTTLPGYYYEEISNTKAGILPFTGGTGTYIYTIVGLLIIAVGTIAYTVYRKNKNSEI